MISYLSPFILTLSVIADIGKTKSENDNSSLNSSRVLGFPDCPANRVLSENVCLLDSYYRADLPLLIKTDDGWKKVETTTVNCESEIISIIEVDNMKQTIELEIFVHLQWRDDRIMVKTEENTFGTWHTLDSNHIKQIWNPDLTIYNMTRLKRLSILNPTNGFLKIYAGNNLSDGVIIDFSFIADVTVGCDFDFSHYPLDEQRCELRMGSTSYGRYLRFVSWYRVPGVTRISTEDNDPPTKIKTKGYYVRISKLTDDFSWCQNLTRKDKNKLCSAKHLQHVIFDVAMKRQYQALFLHYYAPCIAVVLITHTSFIISPDCIPGRISLLIVQFLTLVNMFIDQQVILTY